MGSKDRQKREAKKPSTKKDKGGKRPHETFGQSSVQIVKPPPENK